MQLPGLSWNYINTRTRSNAVRTTRSLFLGSQKLSIPKCVLYCRLADKSPSLGISLLALFPGNVLHHNHEVVLEVPLFRNLVIPTYVAVEQPDLSLVGHLLPWRRFIFMESLEVWRYFIISWIVRNNELVFMQEVQPSFKSSADILALEGIFSNLYLDIKVNGSADNM